MTTIIWSGDTAVASRGVYAGTTYLGLQDGFSWIGRSYVALAGPCHEIRRAIARFVSEDGFLGHSPSEIDVAGLIFDKGVQRPFVVDKGLSEYTIEAPFLCEGAGAQLARGALAAGASVLDAYRIAVQYDITTSPEFDMLCWSAITPVEAGSLPKWHWVLKQRQDIREIKTT